MIDFKNNLNFSNKKVVFWGRESSVDELISTQLFSDLKEYEYNSKDAIFDYLKEWDDIDAHLVLVDGLTKYTTEENYRLALAKLIGCKGVGIAMVVENFDHPSLPVIFRCARVLGISDHINTFRLGGRIYIYFDRGISNLDTILWSKNPAPYIDRVGDGEVTDIITGAIKSQRPLSLIRVGHCEIRFIGYDQFYGVTDVNKSSLIQWGSVAPDNFIRKVKEDLSKSVINSDILGFKSRVTFKVDSLGVLDNSVFSCLSAMSLLRSGQIQTTPNIHFFLGVDANFIDAIKSATKVVIVSPRQTVFEKIKSIVSDLTQVIWFDLPGEARVDGVNDLHCRISRFVEIETLLRKEVSPGVLVLIGAGVAGKVYCDIAKSSGGVGLDLGSTLDAWAGVDSRGAGFSSQLKTALN
ncbi:hypothetical protein C5F52_20070 [Limnohabitans sp. TS-CS-82]|uniref:GT-D fold domain-containing protein n=1 Tax=Limnohabitans sp. TS-CS-82 TaxID=2094193 RepID=UPI000CF28A2E|nr:hypothetical protein [Limnohabitans sp. TS-CS-82]PQA81494.1 hypothetical protein C5F52_20070 [Limnohabitans sp. TS-CS-82]